MTEKEKERVEEVREQKKEGPSSSYDYSASLIRQRKRRSVERAAIVSAIVTIIILIIAAALTYAFRGSILGYLGDGGAYQNGEASSQNVTSKTAVEKQTQVEHVVHSALPSVVSVMISKEVPVYEKKLERVSPFGSFGQSFLVPHVEQNGTQKKQIGGGSGFIVTKDGLVVTNRHVVAEKDASYTVITNDGKTHKAKVVARDPFIDIAFLQIEGGGTYQPLNLGDSSKLQLGQTVIAIGNVLAQYHNTVSVGVVSGLSRSIVAQGEGKSEELSQVIQTDAAINPGNSGGPLLDLSGKVIGINVAYAQGTQSIGFSIPSNLIKESVQSVEKTGEIVEPYLGVRYIPVTAGLIKKNNLKVTHGALVVAGGADELAVLPGSPADKAGIVANDIILSIDAVKITQDDPLGDIIRTKKVGSAITLLVMHDGKKETLHATLQKAPDSLGS